MSHGFDYLLVRASETSPGFLFSRFISVEQCYVSWKIETLLAAGTEQCYVSGCCLVGVGWGHGWDGMLVGIVQLLHLFR
jgi:hypothetical protein